ncbi:Ankyrin repeat domain-containing protein 13C [Acropora cervicornis]|uniref:Ankyrin repeat domain-containing protein 13C n=1 Tax=Acropora cervicornis TaxID=6130 RepID=A0AAD9QY33_ACRCE|nr:Ankyrin repeat domain-containing protein 13C [Acropora cervicornis]
MDSLCDRYPLHKAIFDGNLRKVSGYLRTCNIEEKDVHGNTPLHLAVLLGRKECVYLLLAHGAPVKVKNNFGWSPLAEAISYGDRQIITTLLKKLKQQSRETLEERRPQLTSALQKLGDFYVEINWDFQSWVPLLSRILPSDTCKLYKKGCSIRMDSTLVDFTDMKWQRGDLTFIFNGDARGKQAFAVLDNEKKVFQRLRTEDTEAEIEEEVDILMSRREHLSEEDVVKNKALVETLSKGSGNIMDSLPETTRRSSLNPPPKPELTWDEYMLYDSERLPPIGRKMVLKEDRKAVKCQVAMSEEFPLSIDLVLKVLEVVAPFKHFSKLKDFVAMKLPAGFPVRIEIPVFPTITARVTFRDFKTCDKIPASMFFIPRDYKEDPNRFPDL